MFEIPVITEEVKSIEKNAALTNLEKNNIFNVKTNKIEYHNSNRN